MEPIRIVLAEDHALVREGTRHILEAESDLTVVAEAGDGQEALDLIERLQPDVAVLDIRMPRVSGIEVVRRIAKSSPNTKALILTAYDDDDYILALMDVGAIGYLLKTARATELVEAIHSVNRGEPVLHPVIAAKVAQLWARRRMDVETHHSEELSPREREVLTLAAKGLRNKVIADQLTISVRTVEGHFNNILAKLGVSSRIEAILHAASRHWVVLDEEDS